MSKHVQPYTAQRITFTSARTIDEVQASLDEAINRQSPIGLEVFRDSLSKDQFQESINEKIGPSGFMFFGAASYSFSDKLSHSQSPPKTILYTIGNPLIAQTMIVHDRTTALHVPPQIFIAENANGGSTITYDLPSSVIAIGGRPEDESGELRKAAVSLDEKLEKLMRHISGSERSVL
ncbi:hypothetical protein SISNIDRAFT_483920 [Sistotremastrum niveocremeum HHB9708]|uniref:DUF302 domain-containing protein n=1 Tax=Sistotremastrum niveocremeum HHB9708 TaxID=1314777 RepID=A0A164X756_9AGAM|nr:hypothetical protein SISNIDRAFT_483920 [Sistotremastrum niveocremeum HHB9708]